MDCKVEKSKIKGEIVCPSNKSYTHRGIFLASLAGNNSRIENILLSADTKATIEACKKFGAIIKVENSTIIVKESIKIGTNVPEINTENSGTTIRIAIGIASLFSEEITLTGDESIQKRPMQPLLDALSSIGAKCISTDGKPPIKIKGQITGGDITIPGNLSSQFISSLLITAPLTKKGSMGNLPQGDEAFIDFLEQLGVSVIIDNDEIKIKSPEKLKGGVFDLRNSPDLLPPLAILSLISSNPIEIVNVKHARLKETDRIAILARELPKIGINVEEKEDGLILESSNKLIGANLDSENDHRLFMAFCIAGTYIGNCTVTDSESVKVSYPNFIEEMNRLGAKIQKL
ncbi:3-phosphoshikimate 1-carboxyvinyltransferase [Nitrosopumilus sp.]|nr:3-phosphoshikimate 1-carboxyvinyltransferase [Nitrosopumilus sp.]